MDRKLHKPSMREHCRKFLAQTFLGLNYFWLMSLDLEWPDNSLSRNKRGTINNFTEKKWSKPRNRCKARLSQVGQGGAEQSGTILGKAH